MITTALRKTAEVQNMENSRKVTGFERVDKKLFVFQDRLFTGTRVWKGAQYWFL